MTSLTRRRFLTMSAACAVLPTTARAESALWRGVALGAPASLRIEGLSEDQAAPIFAAIEAELNRLEDIFSLYRPASQLCQLNRDGILRAPAPELLHVLGLCSSLHEASGGVFDPSVQPLWLALASGAPATELRVARAAVGWRGVSVQTSEIRLPHPGTSALTLNGIAQGAITDRVGALLRSYGLQNVLVDMGEILALGRRHDSRDWRVGLAGPGRKVQTSIRLRNRAVATSDPASVKLTGQHGHILHPNEIATPGHVISVSAGSAALADGLSTALCLVAKHTAPKVAARFPSASIELLS